MGSIITPNLASRLLSPRDAPLPERGTVAKAEQCQHVYAHLTPDDAHNALTQVL